jgi:ABC-type multidrug transport system fused ATPase/permease subunit
VVAPTPPELLDSAVAKKARAYSKGNRQKVALIAALASDAELLLLDEPTAGLDPLMEATFRDCVTEERRDGPARRPDRLARGARPGRRRAAGPLPGGPRRAG